MPQFVDNFGMLPRSLQFRPVFGDRLIVASQTGVRKSEMIVSEANGWVEPKRRLELVNRLDAAV